MNTDFTIHVSQNEFGYLWSLLLAEPSGKSRMLMNNLEAQAGAQIKAYEDEQIAKRVQEAAATKAFGAKLVAGAAQAAVAAQAQAQPLGAEQGFVDATPQP
jgi:hypothetical protein